MLPDEEPPTINDENFSESEFKVTVPLFVKLSVIERELFSDKISEPPLSTVILLTTLSSSTEIVAVKPVGIFMLSLSLGSEPKLQLLAVPQFVL